MGMVQANVVGGGGRVGGQKRAKQLGNLTEKCLSEINK